MFQQLELVTGPTIEPVSLSELRTHARIQNTARDTYLESLIPVARLAVERYLNRALIQQTWAAWYESDEHGRWAWQWRYQYKDGIRLPKGKILSVDAVTIYDTDNAATTIPNAEYYLAGNHLLFKRVLAPQRMQMAMRVEFKAGYGTTADAVPGHMKQAILATAAYLNQKPEGQAAEFEYEGQVGTANDLPPQVVALLKHDRMLNL